MNRPRAAGGTAGGRPDKASPYNDGENAGESGYGYGAYGRGGSGAGRGLEPGAGKSGPVSAKAGPEQALITQQGDRYFEYVLPGSEARVPLARAAADSNRAAEGAIAREQLPLEYADFVRWYFLQLTQEAEGEPPEEDEP